ncbi:single-stranded DNA-binding protein [Clostridium beijerinckii]|uniref:single-stranded DNA-binding protein n=1 Tax=Clostridium beijerinckii TaxID=1520 RepID=UPI001F207CA2|nr:single-stranded DNA-binding protein [Clostridium beijerinckii]
MNKVVLIGRLTADPELRFTPGSGASVTTLTLAIDKFVKGEKQVDFVPVVVWGKQAESTANYMTKGSQVAISGRIQTRSYDAKDGTKKYVTEVVADQFGGAEFLGSKGKGNSENNEYSQPVNDAFGSGEFEEDITPVNDPDMPF